MRLGFFIPAITCFVLLLSSCQKEISDYIPPTDSDSTNTDTTSSNNSFLVKHYVEDIYLTSAPDQHNIDSFALSYDSEGRLLTLASLVTPGFKMIYAYSDQSFMMDLYNDNAVSIHENFFLKNELVDSTIQYNDEGDTSTEKYTYNAARQATKIIEYDYTTAGGAIPSDTSVYTYNANGDLSSTTNSDGTISYTYTTNTANTVNLGQTFYTSAPKHLPDAITFTSTDETYKGTHTYTFDDKGRITVDKFVLDIDSVAEKRYYY